MSAKRRSDVHHFAIQTYKITASKRTLQPSTGLINLFSEFSNCLLLFLMLTNVCVSFIGKARQIIYTDNRTSIVDFVNT